MKFPPSSDIRRIRKALDVTQSELQRESGISQSTIAKIEKNRISASYTTVVTLFETLDRIGKEHHQDLTVQEVASKDIISVQITESVKTASELMRASNISQMPVLKNDSPVGSISEKIIFEKIRNGKSMDDLQKMQVMEIMEEPFPIVPENTPISSVTGMMNESNAVLVTSRGILSGMVTRQDILKLI